MEIIRAKSAGACYGVDRAFHIAEEALKEKERINSFGPLIHNPKAVAEFEEKGLRVVLSAEEIDAPCVLIRSHGITPSARNTLKAAHIEIIDATCPYVLKAQKAAASLAKKLGNVIVLGEAKHPEVESLCAYAKQSGAQIYLVSNEEDIENLPLSNKEKYGVVVQTTQDKALLDCLLNSLEEKNISVEVKNTIYSATKTRQDEAKKIAASCDAMLIIGGKNSSNTTRLVELCLKVNKNTYHIEGVEDIRADWFCNTNTLGISAGASTPISQIDAVCEFLQGEDFAKKAESYGAQ